jgi:hypothetical protein
MMARKNRKPSTTRRLHRSFGAIAAVFILFMVLSGLMINHSNSLGLDQRQVSQTTLLDWYGLGKPENIRNYEVGNDWLSFAGSQLYLNGNPITAISNGVGAVFNGEILVAAGNDEILLLDHDGHTIERQPWESSANGPIESIGLLPQGVIALKTGTHLWVSDTQLLNWQLAEGNMPPPLWSSAEVAPGTLEETITRHYRGDGPSLERLLLDLHSGRIFGTIGALIYDLLALAIGFLAISGLLLWVRGRRNGKAK